MAAALIEDPETPHTWEHDLESFFWVLIWAVVSYMPTSLTKEKRSNFLKDTMNPKVYGQCGGGEKRSFLRLKDVPVLEHHLYIHNLLEALIDFFAAQYPDKKSSPPPPLGANTTAIIQAANNTMAPANNKAGNKAFSQYVQSNLNH